jgi:hypothetical protein
LSGFNKNIKDTSLKIIVRYFDKVLHQMSLLTNKNSILLLMVSALALVACEGSTVPDLVKRDGKWVDESEKKRETVLGGSGIVFGGKGGTLSPLNGGGSGSGVGVNAFLWRATLDTMSIWPINSADPFGGVIITDWYAPPGTPNERFKMNIYILGRALRADGVRVSVFKQVKSGSNTWLDSTVLPTTARKLEDAILMRARQFRNNGME